MSWSKGYDSQRNIYIFSLAPQIFKAKEKMYILLGVAGGVMYRRHYMQKRQGERFSNFDSSSFADSDTFNTISYADCAGIEFNKVINPFNSGYIKTIRY